MKGFKITCFKRNDGSLGIRNHVIVISVGMSANHVVTKIGRLEKVPFIIHSKGTDGELGEDANLTLRTIIGTINNPNVHSALIVGLGDERFNAKDISSMIESKTIYYIHVQDIGEKRAINKGRKIVSKLKKLASKQKPIYSNLDCFTLGVKCGASDYTSLFSNTVVGWLSDRIVEAGGSVIFTETTEVIGAEDIIAKRAIREDVKDKFLKVVREHVKTIMEYSPEWLGAQPNYGNIRGGITTIEEKSIGAIKKTGSSKLVSVIAYAERLKDKGLCFMDGPGFDVPAITGLAASGAQAIIFTTGLGEPIGSPIVPTIKVTANAKTFKRMRESIDLDLSPFMYGKESLEDSGKRLLKKLLEVANGIRCNAEKLRHYDFAIWRIGPTL